MPDPVTGTKLVDEVWHLHIASPGEPPPPRVRSCCPDCSPTSKQHWPGVLKPLHADGALNVASWAADYEEDCRMISGGHVIQHSYVSGAALATCGAATVLHLRACVDGGATTRRHDQKKCPVPRQSTCNWNDEGCCAPAAAALQGGSFL